MIVPTLIQIQAISHGEFKPLACAVAFLERFQPGGEATRHISAEHLTIDGANPAMRHNALQGRPSVHLMASWWRAPSSFDYKS